MANGNGHNGHSNGNDAPQLEERTDLAEVGLIAAYMVQMHQNATLQEYLEWAREKLGCIIEPDLLERALDRLKKEDIIAERRSKVRGQSSKVFTIKKLNWRSPPPVTVVKDLIPQLASTPELQDIKSWFDKKEGLGTRGTGGRRGNDIDDYYWFRVQVVTLDPLLGSQIKSQYSEAIQLSHPSEADSLDVEGMFQRDQLTGCYVIPPDVMQGWLVSNGFRYAGLPEARAAYVAFEPIFIRPNAPTFTALKNGKQVMQYVLPVNSSKTGPSAPKAYECIPAGQALTIKFCAPTKGCLHPEQWEKLFHDAGLFPRRGISPARGRRFGRFLVTKFEVLGAVKEATPIDHLYENVPEELLRQHAAYLEDARRRLAQVDLKMPKGGATDVLDESPFPSAEA